MFLATIAAGLLALQATASPVAQVSADPELISVRFKNGTLARVHVVGIQGERVELREFVFDGGMNVRHALDEFEPISAFRVELAARKPQSFEGHAAMARRAAELELPQRAVEQVGEALLHLGGDAEAARKSLELRSWLAQALEGWLHEATERGDLAGASQFLKLIATRYTDLRSEQQLEELALVLEALERDRAAKLRASRQERLDDRARADIARRLEPIREKVQLGDERYRDAIKSSARMTRSADLAAEAIDAYRDAWKASLELQRRHPDDEALVLEIESIANHLHDHAVLAGLHAAELLAVRSNYPGALEWVEQVLAMDPELPEALELKRTITLAKAAASAGWVWGQPPIQSQNR